jgi:hypothetical protein
LKVGCCTFVGSMSAKSMLSLPVIPATVPVKLAESSRTSVPEAPAKVTLPEKGKATSNVSPACIVCTCGGSETVKLFDHGPKPVPSFTRTHRVSVPTPAAPVASYVLVVSTFFTSCHMNWRRSSVRLAQEWLLTRRRISDQRPAVAIVEWHEG